jgi:hypothetical protein
MNNRYMRKLPFPPTSNFTPEVVRQIKAIHDEVIEYSEDELAWMERAVQNLNFMLAISNQGDDILDMVRKRDAYIKVLFPNRPRGS